MSKYSVYEAISEALFKHGIMDATIKINFDSDVALFVEFGTGPAARVQKPVGGESLYDRIRDMLNRKGSRGEGVVTNRKNLDEMAARIRKHILENGTPARPFIRPAIWEAEIIMHRAFKYTPVSPISKESFLYGLRDNIYARMHYFLDAYGLAVEGKSLLSEFTVTVYEHQTGSGLEDIDTGGSYRGRVLRPIEDQHWRPLDDNGEYWLDIMNRPVESRDWGYGTGITRGYADRHNNRMPKWDTDVHGNLLGRKYKFHPFIREFDVNKNNNKITYRIQPTKPTKSTRRR